MEKQFRVFITDTGRSPTPDDEIRPEKLKRKKRFKDKKRKDKIKEGMAEAILDDIYNKEYIKVRALADAGVLKVIKH